MTGPGPICARCHDDKWRLSERGWCDRCEALPEHLCPGTGRRPYRLRIADRERCLNCDRIAYVRLDGTTGGHRQ